LPTSETFAVELRKAASAGEVIASLLFLSGAPVAYVLCFCRDGIATYDYVGFDPEAHALSPGTVLQYLLLEKMFAAGGVDIFDFTEGEGAQKQFFATDHRLCAKTYVLRSGPVNWAAIRAHHFLDVASSRVGLLLDRWGLKARLKKFLRR
jgi:CelD/BcsL family acetyltransferase involved in cellulose biosynthesis